MSSNKRVTKIKVSKDGWIQVNYEELRNQKWDQISLKCHDQARVEFYQALDQLKPCVLEICELKDAWPEDDTLTISGISYSYTNEILGATITALKSLDASNSPLVINTPFKTAVPYSESGDWEVCFTEEQTAALETMAEEALKYAEGERAQKSLFEVAA